MFFTFMAALAGMLVAGDGPNLAAQKKGDCQVN